MQKIKPCTAAPKHKWEWKKDVTVQSSPSPGMLRVSRKGVFSCACGESKYGMPRSGL